MSCLLSEFDADRSALLEPTMFTSKVDGFPTLGVTTFSSAIIDRYAAMPEVRQIDELPATNGALPLYQMEYGGKRVLLFRAPAGAPACVAQFEELVAKGLRKLVMFGSCGVLDHEIADGHLIVPTAAVRDEGTSYHYAPPSDEIAADSALCEMMQRTIRELGYPCATGKTWTTDAIYRETRDKAARRREQGCVCVEMECSAMLAAAKFRGVTFAQFLYAADNLDAPEWEARGLQEFGMTGVDKYMAVALECAIRLP